MSSFVSATYILPLPWKNTRVVDSTASSPSPHPLITPLWTRLQCPRLCAIRGPHIWVCDIRGSKRRQWGGETEGIIEREGGWIDGRNSQWDDRRWIKGKIEMGCRQRGVWQSCSAAPYSALYVTPTFLWTKHTGITLFRQSSYTHFETLALRWNLPVSHVLKVLLDRAVGRVVLPGATWRSTRACNTIGSPN